MKSRVVLRRGAILAVVVPVAVILVVLLATTPPVYSVSQVRSGLLSTPTAWLGRTVQIRARDNYPGGLVAWLVDPGDNPYSQGLPIKIGRWQSPTFPRTLIWWLNSNVPALSGIDGGRVEVYRITLTTPLRRGCPSCPVGHG